MKKISQFMLGMASIVMLPSHAQDFAQAKKVYYTPMQEKIYFVIDMNYVKNDFLVLQNGDKTSNTLAKVAKDAPLYKKNEDYKTGDILRILIESSLDSDDIYSYIKIIGRVSDEVMSRVDGKIHEKANTLFGEGKLEAWPDKYFEDKGIRGKIPNEKDVDADFYILSSIGNFSPDILSEYYGKMGFVKGESENLIIFYIDEISPAKYAVKEMGNGTANYCRINIHWKEKVDKKGKKVGGSTEMDLTTEDKVMTDSFEKATDASGSYFSPLVNGWEVMNAQADELVKTNSVYFEIKVMKAIEKAFEKLK